MPSLDELLAHPERHTLAILALQEVLGGRVTGLHRSAYLASRKEALEALKASGTWKILDHLTGYLEAVRLDGVRIGPELPDHPQEGAIWLMELPPVEYGAPRGRVRLDVADLVAAVARVDELCPMPSWWTEIDREGRPWRHKPPSHHHLGPDGEP